MSQVQNVQRGLLFFFFIYSVITFVFFTIKLIQNRVDKEANAVEEQGNKYEQNKQSKSKDNEKDDSQNKGKTKKKQQKNLPEGQTTIQNLQTKITKTKITKDIKPEQNESRIVTLSLKISHHIHYHLPFIFPFILNIVTGTSYAFLFVLFFFVQIFFVVFNDLKMHNNFVQNRIIKTLLQHMGYVLTFFAWVNLWAVPTSQMPYVIIKR